MPVLRYFVFAGAALLALLFAVNAYLPAPVTAQRDASNLDKTTIRINGTAPVAERVTIDTSIPTIVPPAAQPAALASAQDDSKRDAYARMDDEASVEHAATPVAAPQTPVKKVAARKHPKPRPVVVMARPAGLFALW
jgi:hypothetical protein